MWSVSRDFNRCEKRKLKHFVAEPSQVRFKLDPV